MDKVGHDVFFGVHANCPNFVPLKRKKREIKGKKKQRKEDMRIYQIKKRRGQKRNERRG